MSTSVTAGQAGNSSSASAAILVGRICLSIMFILAGFSKLTAIGGTAGWFASIGLPVPTVTAVVVGLVELIGGLAVLVGYQTRIAALVLALFTIGATLIAHMNFADQTQQLFFMKNLSVVGGFLVLAGVGAGALSVDGRRG
jgi:putative oxidoreductase